MHTQGMAHPQDGVEARLGTGRQSAIEVLAAQATVGGQLGHASRFGHMTQNPQDFVRVPVRKYLGQILVT